MRKHIRHVKGFKPDAEHQRLLDEVLDPVVETVKIGGRSFPINGTMGMLIMRVMQALRNDNILFQMMLALSMQRGVEPDDYIPHMLSVACAKLITLADDGIVALMEEPEAFALAQKEAQDARVAAHSDEIEAFKAKHTDLTLGHTAEALDAIGAHFGKGKDNDDRPGYL